MSRFTSVQEIKAAAIYKFGACRCIEKGALADLLVLRTELKRPQAEQLVAHWITTEAYRPKRKESPSSQGAGVDG